MLTIEDLHRAFELYFLEVNRCRQAKAWFAALHMALVIPDVCGSLEYPDAAIGDRYARWCGENFPTDPNMTPDDRFQMRCMVLHQGSSSPQNKGKTHHSQYSSFSFVPPGEEPKDRDTHFARDDRHGNITVYITRLVESTFDHALPKWIASVAASSTRNAIVHPNLRTLMRRQDKDLPFAHGLAGAPFIVISSTS